MADAKEPTAPGGQIRVGTSGFSYDDWKGPFYPLTLAKSHMLEFYANTFDTVEINATYYAIPGPLSIEAMLRKVGDTFEFVVKAHQDMTHQRERAQETVPRFREAVAPLAAAGRLGCILLQFPYSFHCTAPNRDFVKALVEQLAPHPVVVEFRHRAWVTDETMALLKALGAGYCAVDEPALAGLPPPRAEATSSIGYVRFHGRNKEKWWEHEKAEERYDYTYSAEELEEWIPRIKKLAAAALRVFVFFNNHVRGQAVRNAQELKARLGLR